MSKRVLLVLIAVAVPACAKTAKPADTDHNITVHVSSSRLIYHQGWNQLLETTIDGKKYELEALEHFGVLRIGDYKARISEENTKRPYEYNRKYEFLFPDGTVRSFMVVGESDQ